MGPNKKLDMSIGETIISTITELPVGLQIGSRHFNLYPASVGKTFIVSQLIKSLDINNEALMVDPYLEMLSTVKKKRDLCCRIIAYYTLNKKQDILNSRKVKERQSIFLKELNDEDITTVLLIILNDDAVSKICKDTGIDKETTRMADVNRCKDTKNTFVFGGKTIWGNLIDIACERYGWSFEYVLWGISYNNLTLMLKDKITSVFLSDEEMKKCHISRDRDFINGDDPEAVKREINKHRYYL